MDCAKPYDNDLVLTSQGVPRCAVRPDVVLYEEQLNNDDISAAINYIRKAGVLIIGGTSLVVYPAAGLIEYYNGSNLVLVNRDSTPKDHLADLVIHEKIGELFSKLHI